MLDWVERRRRLAAQAHRDPARGAAVADDDHDTARGGSGRLQAQRHRAG
jgi:hypothetical protein